jgi:DivIVA domain-containing protein
VERDSIDRIRSATFRVGRRGYEKREVDRFLNKLADWLETGGGDQTRAELLRRELERVGQHTGKILTEAHEVGERLRAEAEVEGRRIVDEATTHAEHVRAVADRQAAEVRAAAQKARAGADEYVEKTLAEAETAAAELRRQAEGDAEGIVAKARAEATRIVDEANQRRADIEAVISDLKDRRDTVLADMQRLSSELAGTATEHGPAAPTAEPGIGSSEAEAAPRPARRPKATR